MSSSTDTVGMKLGEPLLAIENGPGAPGQGERMEILSNSGVNVSDNNDDCHRQNNLSGGGNACGQSQHPKRRWETAHKIAVADETASIPPGFEILQTVSLNRTPTSDDSGCWMTPQGQGEKGKFSPSAPDSNLWARVQPPNGNGLQYGPVELPAENGHGQRNLSCIREDTMTPIRLAQQPQLQPRMDVGFGDQNVQYFVPEREQEQLKSYGDPSVGYRCPQQWNGVQLGPTGPPPGFPASPIDIDVVVPGRTRSLSPWSNCGPPSRKRLYQREVAADPTLSESETLSSDSASTPAPAWSKNQETCEENEYERRYLKQRMMNGFQERSILGPLPQAGIASYLEHSTPTPRPTPSQFPREYNHNPNSQPNYGIQNMNMTQNQNQSQGMMHNNFFKNPNFNFSGAGIATVATPIETQNQNQNQPLLSQRPQVDQFQQFHAQNQNQIPFQNWNYQNQNQNQIRNLNTMFSEMSISNTNAQAPENQNQSLNLNRNQLNFVNQAQVLKAQPAVLQHITGANGTKKLCLSPPARILAFNQDKKIYEYECVFCKGNNQEEKVYKSHPIRLNDVVVCPALRKYICSICGATGDDAHTLKYCPYNHRGFFSQPAGRHSLQTMSAMSASASRNFLIAGNNAPASMGTSGSDHAAMPMPTPTPMKHPVVRKLDFENFDSDMTPPTFPPPPASYRFYIDISLQKPFSASKVQTVVPCEQEQE